MLFSKKPTIKIIKEYDVILPNQKGKGIIFLVSNGKGILQQAYGSKGERGLYSLMFEDVPLIRLHGDNYMCPTCEKLISAGYGIDKVDDSVINKIRDTLNGTFESLPKSLYNLDPLLGLLPSGVYAMNDIDLYPTDGDGNFFWTINNTPKQNKASCPVYEKGNWFFEYPAFLLPSQPPTSFNLERAQYYQNKTDCRAIAFNIGFHNVLLDGHHKATAAALEGRKLKTLVIFPASSLPVPTNKNQHEAKLQLGIDWFSIEDLGIGKNEEKIRVTSRRLSEIETEKYTALIEKNFDDYLWTEKILQSAKKFPDVKALAYLEWGGELTNNRLDRIMERKEFLDESQAIYLCTALQVTNNPRFCELAFQIAKDERYVRIWVDIFKLISRIYTQEVEEFFIDFLVYDEKIRPEVTRIANDYLSKDNNYMEVKIEDSSCI